MRGVILALPPPLGPAAVTVKVCCVEVKLQRHGDTMVSPDLRAQVLHDTQDTPILVQEPAGLSFVQNNSPDI